MTPFPFDNQQFSPLRVDLSGVNAINIDADWYYHFTLYTDATTVAYDIGDWYQEGRLVFKEKPSDSDANAIATGDAVVETTSLGEGYLFLARNSIDPAWIGKRLYYSWKGTNDTYWFPLLYGFVQIRNTPTYTED